MSERRVTVSDLALLALRMSELPCRRLCGAERAELSHEFLAGFLAATGNNDAVAFPRESKRRRAPDSSERAGDQDNRGTHVAAPSDFGCL